ncbi:hypothetical protein [Novosphingobium album (ex Hu et al. 2023)]|uniref:Uncharacterized protein n=1 Tax=Novosphingobium album (ex Hu et al. 2023) TaxID=2930093 RepID=A0ABT0B0X6_9SPHN|nr:hypothetical protein [Novosphingobium album (ex Hu et al. 2023)]MCJ2178677.1 hypothetical protein [Novosphingobium album (ex Hu et al. 2023)]
MSGAWIGVRAGFDALATQLVRRARTLAAAHLQTRVLAARGDETRWRRPDLIWPLFTKG